MQLKGEIMKKIWMFGLLMMICPMVFAGSITLNYPEGQKNRIIEALTVNGEACDKGETLGVCAKRRLKRDMIAIVSDYERQKQAQAAREAVAEVDVY